ncbi:3050_t:CDS:10 [Entrophospora sp. SA101]|nr:3050_t:CDS:10 [Entrophospora sp. SA101]
MSSPNYNKLGVSDVGLSCYEKKKDVIVYSSFDELATASSSRTNSINRSVLVLGYPDGFQIWDISNVDNVNELISIRDDEKIGEVKVAKIIPNPRIASKDDIDEYADQQHSSKESYNSQDHLYKSTPLFPPKPKTVLHLFSLRTHEIVKTVDGIDEGNIVGIKCNERVIALGTTNPSRISIYSTLNLSPMYTLKDVALHPISKTPIFTLGLRLIAYATTSFPPENNIKKKKDVGYYLGEVAKGVANVVSGVKFLGDYGFQTLSSYFGNPSNSHTNINKTPSSVTMPINIKNHNGTISPISFNSSSPQQSPSSNNINGIHHHHHHQRNIHNNGGSIDMVNGLHNNETEKENGAIGTIIIHPNIIAHFTPHTHPVGYLSFNPSGTFLYSTSTQGHQFHVFEIFGNNKYRRVANGGVGNNIGGSRSVKRVYKLSRGITDAIVGEGGVCWSEDSRWCGVATGRGTIHIFAINPYGGLTHIPSHLSGWVINLQEPSYLSSSTLSPVVRIKPRTPLPQDPTESIDNVNNINDDDLIFHQQQHFDNQVQYMQQQSLPSQLPLVIPHHHLRKPPGICFKFIPSLSSTTSSKSSLSNDNKINKHLNANLHEKRQVRKRSSIPNPSSPSVTSASLSPSSSSAQSYNSNYHQQTEKLEDVGYQDLWSFHPTGVLTLHRVWLESVILGGQLAGGAAAVANVGRVLVDGATGVVNMDVVGNKWLANAEIETYTNSRLSLPPPLWECPQFTLQIFTAGFNDYINKGNVPLANKVDIRNPLLSTGYFGGVVGKDSSSKNSSNNKGRNNQNGLHKENQQHDQSRESDIDLSELSSAIDTKLDLSTSSEVAIGNKNGSDGNNFDLNDNNNKTTTIPITTTANTDSNDTELIKPYSIPYVINPKSSQSLTASLLTPHNSSEFDDIIKEEQEQKPITAITNNTSTGKNSYDFSNEFSDSLFGSGEFESSFLFSNDDNLSSVRNDEQHINELV